MERIAIFIDGSNFYHGMKSNIGTKANIDFSKFVDLLCAGRNLVRVYYYNAPVRKEDGEERYKSQQRFFQKLYQLPYFAVTLGRLEKRGKTVIEKGVDINIAVDMLRLANTYDTAILVSADGDFSPAVEAVKDLGKHVENAHFRGEHPYHLIKACDKFIALDKKILKDCFLK